MMKLFKNTKGTRKRSKFSRGRKLLIAALALMIVLAGSFAAFAATNPDALQPFVAQVQELFSRDSVVVSQPVPAEEAGIAALSSGREVILYSTGEGFVAAITADGSLWTWGGNINGRLGLGDTIHRTAPQRVEAPGVSSWVYVAAGINHTLAIDQDGNMWGWGQNSRGQVGNGNSIHQHSPVLITEGATSWRSVSGSSTHTLAIDSDNNLWAWGGHHNGRLGNGTIGTLDFTSTPQLITAGPGLGNWDVVAAGSDSSAGIDMDGNVWTWGSNMHSQLAIGVGSGGDGTNRLFPTPIVGTGLPQFQHIEQGTNYVMALGVDGTLWSWGNNTNGRLGTGFGAGQNHFTPRQVTASGVNYWRTFSAGAAHGVALDDQGRLWGWGYNLHGSLGRNINSGNSNTPVLIPVTVPIMNYANRSGETMPETWQSVSAGWAGVVAMCEDGRLWSWGANGGPMTAVFNGQLGKGISTAPTSNNGTNTNNWRPWRIAASLIPTGSGNSSNWQSPNNATIPNHNATNVTNINTPYVYIFFDRLMCTEATSRGTITFIQQGNSANRIDVDLTNFEWASTQAEFNEWPPNHPSGVMDHPNRGVQSVFRVPLPLLESNTTYVALVEGFLDASFGMRGANEMYPHGTATLPLGHPMSGAYPDRPWIFTTGDIEPPPPPPPPQELLITKTLEMPAGTTIPDATFAFAFTPVQVLGVSTSPARDSVPVANVPTISPNPTIAIDHTTVDMVDPPGTIMTVTGTLDLRALIETVLASAEPGVYVWNVHEVRYSSNTTSPSYMDYDPARFQVRAWVGNSGDISLIEIYELNYDDGSWIAGDKTDDIEFVNTYHRTTDLEVGKTIPDTSDNELASRNTLFDFTVALTAHELVSLPNPLVATIYSGTTEVARTVTIAPATPTNIATLTFQLRDGERLVIPGLPAGTTFSATEAQHPDFAPSVTVVIGGSDAHSDSEGMNTALGTGNFILAPSGRNAADFENNTTSTLLTGLIVSNAPIGIAVVLALAAIVALLMLKPRRAAEELPVSRI